MAAKERTPAAPALIGEVEPGEYEQLGDVEGPISFDAMAQDTIAFIERVVGEPAHLVGCSDGAIVGLSAALRRPSLVRRLVLVAGVFHRDGWVPQAIDRDNEPPEFLRRLYGEVSPDGIDHYPGHPRGHARPIAGLARGPDQHLLVATSTTETLIFDPRPSLPESRLSEAAGTLNKGLSRRITAAIDHCA